MCKREINFISLKTTLHSSIDFPNNKKFYQNNIELKNPETGEVLTSEEFNSLIKNNVSNFINRSFYNIIVLAGAGASVVTNSSKYGKIVFSIAKEIKKALDNDDSLFSLKELAQKSKYKHSVVNNKDELDYNFNLENFLSNLITFKHYLSNTIKNKYLSSEQKIYEIIKKSTIYDFDDKDLNHAKFINTLSKKVKKPSKLTIVTTNYDTLFEEAADSLEFTTIDGFTFSHKPHFNSDMFEWNLVKNIENITTKELEYKSNVLNLLKIHGSLTWEQDNNKIIRKDKTAINNPIMIFPSSNKYMQSYQEPYFELFTKFQEFLKCPNTLLITTGFSFSDMHISKMITQAIKRNKSLSMLVTDYNINQNHDNWIELKELMNTGYQIAFLKATMNSDLTYYLGD